MSACHASLFYPDRIWFSSSPMVAKWKDAAALPHPLRSGRCLQNFGNGSRLQSIDSMRWSRRHGLFPAGHHARGDQTAAGPRGAGHRIRSAAGDDSRGQPAHSLTRPVAWPPLCIRAGVPPLTASTTSLRPSYTGTCRESQVALATLVRATRVARCHCCCYHYCSCAGSHNKQFLKKTESHRLEIAKSKRKNIYFKNGNTDLSKCL